MGSTTITIKERIASKKEIKIKMERLVGKYCILSTYRDVATIVL
jgi:hypothetical protein